ncbi:MAG: dicarboxylate/amino acid:cation symporter [Lysobacterales bacterium]|nr:MAG: dicarboxylate/amino acid:cation symporter [Xanthomonadales bacterium]
MKQTSRTLVGLAAGLAGGLVMSLVDNSTAQNFARAIEPVGSVWVSLLTMTVIPLVVSLVITSIASAGDSDNFGRIAGKALWVFLLLYLVVAVLTALIAPMLVAVLNLSWGSIVSSENPATAPVEEDATAAVSFADRIVAMIPSNPFAAAVNGEIFPLAVFAMMFGLAIARIRREQRQAAVCFFQGVADAMLIIVRWVLVLAPVGIFAVVLPLAARLGFAIVGALAYYVALLSLLFTLCTLAFYPVACVFGRIPALRFARASAPVQLVALGTQSSLATLPAMIEAAEVRLGLPQRVTGIVLPLAVTVFRVSAPIWLIVASVFVARMYDVPLGPTQIALVCLLSVLMSIGGVGLPSGASYFAPITPVFLAVGLPVEAIALLFAVDAIPDMIATVANVTGDMAVTTIVSPRGQTAEPAVDHTT